MLFDETEAPYSDAQMAEAKANAQTRFVLWRRRTLYAVALFALTCAAVYPFVDGHHLSQSEETIKQILLLAWLALLLGLLYSALLLCGAFRSVRDLKAASGSES